MVAIGVNLLKSPESVCRMPRSGNAGPQLFVNSENKNNQIIDALSGIHISSFNSINKILFSTYVLLVDSRRNKHLAVFLMSKVKNS